MLICLSANHSSASFALLEALSVSGPSVAPELVDSTDCVAGAVVLATCNRFEAYLDIDERLVLDRRDASDRVLESLSSSTGVERSDLESAIEVVSGDAVVGHLFAVSAGLKSVVVGEDEIAGQVRRALVSSRSGGTSTPSLERLFQKASTASRGVKTQTAIGHAGRSLVRLALELAASRVPDWATARVLLIGTGHYAATTVAALRDRGARSITVYSPSGRAERFATKQSLQFTDDLSDALGRCDIVITCTSRPEPVVTPELLIAGLRMLVVDLGLPRNVHPDVAAVEGVELLDLETIRLHAPIEELNASDDALELIQDAAAEFHSREAEREAAPAIATMRRQVFGVLESEIERSRRRGTWTPEAEADMRHLIGVLLHAPSERAREFARDGEADSVASAVETLFGPVVPNAIASRRDEQSQDPAARASHSKRA